MKRSLLLLVPAIAFALGAVAHDAPISMPAYVPKELARARFVSAFKLRLMKNAIRQAVEIKPTVFLTQFSALSKPDALLVWASVSPDHTRAWEPPNVPKPEALLDAIVAHASTGFGVAPKSLSIRVTCGFVAQPSTCFAAWMDGQSHILPPDADDATRLALEEKMREHGLIR